MFTKNIKTIYLVTALFFTTVVTAQSTTDAPKTVPVDTALKTIKIKVGGITCPGDCKDIEKEVNKLDGIKAFKLIGKPSATSTFQISFNASLVTEAAIRTKVESTPGCEDPKEKPYKVKKG